MIKVMEMETRVRQTIASAINFLFPLVDDIKGRSSVHGLLLRDNVTECQFVKGMGGGGYIWRRILDECKEGP